MRVYQSLFVDLADSFIEYINNLTITLKPMGGRQNLYLKLKNLYTIIVILMFYYFIERFPLIKGLLIVPDGEIPEETQKINLKLFYESLRTHNPMG